MDDAEDWENDPFGEMAVRLGYCTGKDVRDALNQQQKQRSREGEQKRIGAILLEDGILTSEQVISILRMLDQQEGQEAS